MNDCFAGKAVALALSEKGLFVTIVDFSEQRGNQLLHLLEKNIQKFYSDLKHAPAMFIKCDVTNEGMLVLLLFCLCFIFFLRHGCISILYETTKFLMFRW